MNEDEKRIKEENQKIQTLGFEKDKNGNLYYLDGL
jgi:hypothetical protein